jgi:hypothetical protein
MAVPACSGRVLRLPFALQIAKDNGTVASLGPKPSGGVRRGVDIIVMSRFSRIVRASKVRFTDYTVRNCLRKNESLSISVHSSMRVFFE